MRVHLDDCLPDDGALAVLPGSHQAGKLDDDAIGRLAASPFVVCEARAGDALLMRPLLVHRSSAATNPRHRRVLHVLYAPDGPSELLEWRRPA